MKAINVLAMSLGCLLVVGLVGCDSDVSVENKLNLQVYQSPTGTDSYQWQSLQVQITGVGSMPCEPYTAGMGITLPAIPYDQEFQVVVEMYGLPDCQNLVSRGASIPTTQTTDGASSNLFVLVSPVGVFTPPVGVETLQENGAFSPRIGSSVTELPDGRVVIIGGAQLLPESPTYPGVQESLSTGGALRSWEERSNYGEVLDTVEIYDPATGTFTQLYADEGAATTLYYRRAFHAALYLKSLNMIAVIGGITQTTVGSLQACTDNSQCPAGSVEVCNADGLCRQPITETGAIELFDVANQQFLNFQEVGSLAIPRVHATATALNYGGSDEFILVTGGTNSIDPTTAQSTFEVVAPAPVDHLKEYSVTVAGRYMHKAVEVETSQGTPYVWFVGGLCEPGAVGSAAGKCGYGEEGITATQDLIDIFDVLGGFIVAPPAGSDAPSGLDGGRVGHSVHFVEATDQQPSSVYVLGGFSDVGRSEAVSRIEVLISDTGRPPEDEFGNPLLTAASNFNLVTGRGHHGSAVLPDKRILVMGGLKVENGELAGVTTTEIIGPVVTSTGSTVQASEVPLAGMLTPRFAFDTVALTTDQVLVTGGLTKADSKVRMVQLLDATDVTTKTAELFIHNPGEICQGQGFCQVSDLSGSTVAQEEILTGGVDTGNSAGGVETTPGTPGF